MSGGRRNGHPRYGYSKMNIPGFTNFAVLLLRISGLLYHTFSGVASLPGREFVLGFMENRIIVDYPVARLYISTLSTRPVLVTLSVPGLANDLIWWSSAEFTDITYQVKVGESVTHEFPYDIHMSGSGIEDKGLVITATGDISVQAASINDLSSDAFLALPVAALGTEYYCVSYKYKHESMFNQGPSEIGIVAVLDDTLLEITIPENVTISYPGYDVIQTGRVLTLTLMQYQTYQVQSPDDLTGVRITANRKIAVLSGSVWTSVDSELMGDHLLEQMAPVSAWGNRYLTSPLATRSNGDIFRILGGFPDTSVSITRLEGENKTITNLEAGEYIDIDVGSHEFAYIESTNPVLLTQYCKSYQSDNNRESDPFMSLVPPLVHYTDFYTFTTADSLTGEEAYHHYVNLVVQRRGTRRILLDGHLLQPKDFHQVWTVIPQTSFRYAAIKVSAGMHVLQQGDGFRFGAIGYGLKTQESYGFPIGVVSNFPWYDLGNIWEDAATTLLATTSVASTTESVLTTTFEETTAVETSTVMDTSTEQSETTTIDLSTNMAWTEHITSTAQDTTTVLSTLDYTTDVVSSKLEETETTVRDTAVPNTEISYHPTDKVTTFNLQSSESPDTTIMPLPTNTVSASTGEISTEAVVKETTPVLTSTLSSTEADSTIEILTNHLASSTQEDTTVVTTAEETTTDDIETTIYTTINPTTEGGFLTTEDITSPVPATNITAIDEVSSTIKTTVMETSTAIPTSYVSSTSEWTTQDESTSFLSTTVETTLESTTESFTTSPEMTLDITTIVIALSTNKGNVTFPDLSTASYIGSNITYSYTNYTANATTEIPAGNVTITYIERPKSSASEKKNSYSYIAIPVALLLGIPMFCVICCVCCSTGCKQACCCCCGCCVCCKKKRMKKKWEGHQKVSPRDKLSRVSPVPSISGSGSNSLSFSSVGDGKSLIAEHGESLFAKKTAPTVPRYPPISLDDPAYMCQKTLCLADELLRKHHTRSQSGKKRLKSAYRNNIIGILASEIPDKVSKGCDTVLRESGKYMKQGNDHLQGLASAKTSLDSDTFSSDHRIFINDEEESKKGVNIWIPSKRGRGKSALSSSSECNLSSNYDRKNYTNVEVEICECKNSHLDPRTLPRPKSAMPRVTYTETRTSNDFVINNLDRDHYSQDGDPSEDFIDRSVAYVHSFVTAAESDSSDIVHMGNVHTVQEPLNPSQLRYSTGSEWSVPRSSLETIPEQTISPNIQTALRLLKTPTSRMSSNKPLIQKQPLEPIKEKMSASAGTQTDSPSYPTPVFNLCSISSPNLYDSTSESVGSESDGNIIGNTKKITGKPPKPKRRKKIITN